MTIKTRTGTFIGLSAILAVLLISACGNSTPIATQQATSTPTPTALAVADPPTPTTPPSLCEGLSGELEIQILVGPSEAVGLEPVSVGSIPFAVTTDQQPYLLQGSSSFDYADILIKEWGTYDVTMEMAGFITGTCVVDDQAGGLEISLELSGSQVLVVTADGFSQTYPWEGTLPFVYTFPLEEGAALEGEGYSIVLHLN